MNTYTIVAMVVAGIALSLVGSWVLGKDYLRSLFSEPDPVKAPKRQPYKRRECPSCHKQYAVSRAGRYVHHRELVCQARIARLGE